MPHAPFNRAPFSLQAVALGADDALVKELKAKLQDRCYKVGRLRHRLGFLEKKIAAFAPPSENAAPVVPVKPQWIGASAALGSSKHVAAQAGGNRVGSMLDAEQELGQGLLSLSEAMPAVAKSSLPSQPSTGDAERHQFVAVAARAAREVTTAPTCTPTVVRPRCPNSLQQHVL